MKRFVAGVADCANTLPRSILPRLRPYDLILRALDQKGSISVSLLRRIHALIITNGLSSKSVLACRLIVVYGRLLGVGRARNLFDVLPKRTVQLYNCMLKAYVDERSCRSAIGLYLNMLSTKDIPPDSMTFSILIRGCVDTGEIQVGRLLHAHVLVTGSEVDMHLATDFVSLYSRCSRLDICWKLFEVTPQRDIVVWTAMIDSLLRNSDYDGALRLFSDLRVLGLEANVATWNALIAGFARNDLMFEALHHFRLMQVDGAKPDKVSVCTILPLLSRYSILKIGLGVHAYVTRNGFQLDLFVASALVDMYAKCGKLVVARRLFDQISVKDTGLWNAIIVGFGMHGNSKEALQLFHQMIDLGVRPNEITLTSILSMCSHAGLVDEGCFIFNLMVGKYGSVLSHEHYTCMVDLLGRAGQLEEAFNLINNMPVEPSRDVWGALLSACRIHPDVKLAEAVTQQMLVRKDTSQEAGYLVMMSNIYADFGQWMDVARLRTQIRDAGLKKRMGCSWIEVGDTVHIFKMFDTSHPQSEEICVLLRNLESAISVVNFCSNLSVKMLD